MAIQDYQWVSGFNNSGTLANVETDLPIFQGQIVHVSALGSWNPGIVRPRADRSTLTAGYEFVAWTFSALSLAQYAYIQTMYTVGGNSHYGKLTIATPIEDGTFTNYNAHLYLPMQSELSRVSQMFTNVVLRFGLDGTAT